MINWINNSTYRTIFCKIFTCLATVVFAVICANFISRAQSQVDGLQAPTLEECRVLVTNTTKESSLELFLFNPAITDSGELNTTLEEIQQLRTCIRLFPNDEKIESISHLGTLIEYYLIFAGSDREISGQSRLEVVELKNSDDPGIIRLREKINIPPPEGFVFIRFYPSRQSMPPEIQKFFTDPQVAGVTILTRYIAILEERNNSLINTALQVQSLPRIISHELVHAYINILSYDNNYDSMPDFPRWFDEGLATYISKSHLPHAVVTPNLTMTQTTTREYERYQLIFQYLEAKLGSQELFSRIRDSISSANPSKLYSNLGIIDERWLEIQSQSWQARRIQQRAIITIFFFGLITLVLYRLLPEYKCQCGYSGKYRDFRNGTCPECNQSIEIIHPVPNSTPVVLLSKCQICKRTFWPWQLRDLVRSKRWLRVWVENPPDLGNPLSRYVTSICTNCQIKSQSNYDRAREINKEKFAQEFKTLLPMVERWLESAPQLPTYLAKNVHPFVLNEVALILTNSLLLAEYQDWLEPLSLDYRFIAPTDIYRQMNAQLLTSISYQNILQNTNTNEIGSIFVINTGQTGIIWHDWETNII